MSSTPTLISINYIFKKSLPLIFSSSSLQTSHHFSRIPLFSLANKRNNINIINNMSLRYHDKPPPEFRPVTPPEPDVIPREVPGIGLPPAPEVEPVPPDVIEPSPVPRRPPGEPSPGPEMPVPPMPSPPGPDIPMPSPPEILPPERPPDVLPPMPPEILPPPVTPPDVPPPMGPGRLIFK